MATDFSFMEYVCDQLAGVTQISHRKMFGEYALYCNGKVVALVCDNQLFIKPTHAGREYIFKVSDNDAVTEGFPYEGAKPWFLVQDLLEDHQSLCQLVRLTEHELPLPKPKKPKTKTKT
jgi:TfoX/Sxy family transcriptional regulator of competence genes